MSPQAAALVLADGFAFEELHTDEGLARLDARFLDWLQARAPAEAQALREARAAPPEDRKAEAARLLALAPHVEAFIVRLFGIVDEAAALRARHTELAPLFRAKWKFVKRQGLLRHDGASVADFDGVGAEGLIAQWLGQPFEELAFARAVLAWQKTDPPPTERLELAARYSAWAVLTPAGQARHPRSVLFRHPRQIDPDALVEDLVAPVPKAPVPVQRIALHRRRARDGFGLTDPGTDLRGALDEAHYCLLCHASGTDSCSRGLRAAPTATGDGPWKRSAHGAVLAGCPLEERISEFHAARQQGLAIAALALIVIDNPMVAATGHRICNDCMKSCIYQQQTPVDIPQAETRTLRDVLELPWGVEIYALLTRWNPLNLRQPVPAPDSGRRVLVAGLGPAGFTLAHHLLNRGHAVFAVDGLKIEPLPAAWSGRDADGCRVPFEPVLDVESLREPLDARPIGGFGGVAEYGITSRWDKNFLTIVRLLLERRERFAYAGGVRLGSNLSIDDAFAAGADHVALAIGAGRPTVPDLPHVMARGVRTASDFLMALQLTGAARRDSIANLQLRLPVVVIGGGLTAVDTATESLAYYVVQVERFLEREEALERLGEPGEPRSTHEAEIAAEWLAHGRAVRAERARAAAAGCAPDFGALLDAWGGATIVYRRRLQDSPAYRLNHEELQKAFEEGVRYLERAVPTAIEVDAAGAACALTVRIGEDTRRIAARAVLLAAGTQPNTVPVREAPQWLDLDGRWLARVDAHGEPQPHPPVGDPKPAEPGVLVHARPDGRAVSCFGDLHPAFSGNVVKAMASARRGAPEIDAVLGRRSDPPAPGTFDEWAGALHEALGARVARVTRLAPGIVEVVVHAPLAARRFRPGQFYRLQNLEARAASVTLPGVAPTRLAMEGLALTGAWSDTDRGLLGTVVLEMGGSADLCADLAQGEPVVLMGPTGTPTEIPSGQTVLLVGGGLGNAVLFSIGAALRAAGCRVLYFAGYRRAADRTNVERIEAAADTIVWCCDEAPGFSPGRPQDRAFVGNVVEALLAWDTGRLGSAAPPLAAVDRVIAIGSDRMMAAVAAARRGPLAGRLRAGHQAIGSINSPMQCMMKEICGQCLQLQVDPHTGARRFVFSCAEQDQPLDAVDFGVLADRLSQNAVPEHQTARWLRACRQAGQPATGRE